MPPQKQTWLITGGSSGLGLALALHCLSRDISVLATARDPSAAATAHPELEARGGQWLKLDVSAPSTETTVATLAAAHDVSCVVNAAGYASMGAVEQVSDDEVRRQMETNLFGPLRVIRGALPTLRTREGGGTVVNFSSGAGVAGRPGMGIYSASKFALEGASEALAAEVGPLGVRVVVLVLGAFRTGFSGRSTASEAKGPYQNGPVAKTLERTARLGEEAKGDPEKAAEVIVDAVLGEGEMQGYEKYLRLALGSDMLQLYKMKARDTQLNVDAMEELAGRTDFD